jgi:hydrogenase maturation protein HypF
VRGDLEEAVNLLRRRKRREGKPFALMVAELEIARRYVVLSAQAETTLTSVVKPIVLAPRRSQAQIASGVAPGNSRLGVMLPYTPLQSLLFDNPLLAEMPLVMTSANFSNEPLVIDDQEARRRLDEICDHFLIHDRPIERPVDDSVLLDLPGSAPLPIRRARGIVPSSIRLPNALIDGGDGLAVGGDLKSTLAVMRGGEVILSQHLGDLEEARTFDAYVKAADDLLRLYEVNPTWVAHDSHPDYFSTRFAAELATRFDCHLIATQHHHAHACSLMAEHGKDEQILALVCDGTGYGTDGTIWGGELLLCDLRGFNRLARLRPIALAGGDRAAKDIRRSALAVLLDTFGSTVLNESPAEQIMADQHQRHLVAQMIAARVNTIDSSGAGRLFDAVACLLGLAGRNDYEGQAAQALESCADQANPEIIPQPLAIELHPVEGRGDLLELDWRPMIRWLVNQLSEGTGREVLAAAFHNALADSLLRVTESASRSTGLRRVGLSGGVFCNARLTQRLCAQFAERGYTVLRHQRVPANDGGLALGQAAAARARLSRDTE